MTTKSELIKENEMLKERLKKEQSKTTCYRCNGSGKYWIYGMDNEESCPYCNGRGVS